MRLEIVLPTGDSICGMRALRNVRGLVPTESIVQVSTTCVSGSSRVLFAVSLSALIDRPAERLCRLSVKDRDLSRLKSKILAGVALVMSACLVLVGCDAARVGGGATESAVVDPGLPTVGLDAASVEVVGVPIEPVVDEAASSLVIRLGAFVPDPHAERVPYSDAYLPEIYEGLMRFGPDGVELGLAAGFSVNEEGMVYEFTLRSDLRFSNGEPVTAGDFKWSWERALSPRNSKGRGRVVLGEIVGAESVMTDEGDELAGVTVIDDRTLRVELASELPSFPELLAEPAATVLHRPNVENWGFDWSSWRQPAASHIRPWYFDELPVGTGPFALTEFNFWNSTAEVNRNEHYWDALPGVDRIELVSSETLIDSLDPGPLLDERAVDVVFAFGLSGLAADIDGAIGPVPVRFSVPSELELLVLDPRVEEVSDLDFRRALAASVTRPVSSGVSVWTDLGPFGSVRWHETAVILPLASGRESQEDSRPGDKLETAVAEFALDRVGESRRPEPITLEYFDATRGPEDTLNQRIEGWTRDLGVGLLPVYTLDSHTWFPPAGRWRSRGSGSRRLLEVPMVTSRRLICSSVRTTMRRRWFGSGSCLSARFLRLTM